MRNAALFSFLALATLATQTAHTAPPAAWDCPAKVGDLPAALAKLDETSAALPPALIPTASFQRLLLKIRAGSAAAEWREAVGKFAASGEQTPVATGLRDRKSVV